MVQEDLEAIIESRKRPALFKEIQTERKAKIKKANKKNSLVSASSLLQVKRMKSEQELQCSSFAINTKDKP